MPHPLDGPLLKIEWAKKHIRDLNRLVDRFLGGHPYEPISYDEPETGDWVIRARILRQPPHNLSLPLGDAIHNLRSALDHLAWQLSPNPSDPEQIGFPILRSPNGLEAEIRRKIQGASDRTVRRIEALKPYQGGNEALWWLHRLDIYDKHRLLVIVGVAVQQMTTDRTGLAGFPSTFMGDRPEVTAVGSGVNLRAVFLPRQRTLLEQGTEIYRMPFSSVIPEMDMNPQFTFHVAFAEPEIVKGQAIAPTLQQLAGEVEKIVIGFGDMLPS